MSGGKEIKLTPLHKKLPEALDEAHKQGMAPWKDAISEDFHVAVFKDKYAVSEGHLLFVPQYATIDVIGDAFDDALRKGMAMVHNGECDGFNIGLNWGKAAGQTVDWPHIHLIPRRDGDCEDPTGGVRGVIPGKANYKNGIKNVGLRDAYDEVSFHDTKYGE